MSDEYSIEALEQDIAHLMNDIKARDVEIARLRAATTASLDRVTEELAKTRVEAIAVLGQANEEIARLRARIAELEEWGPVPGISLACDCACGCSAKLLVNDSFLQIKDGDQVLEIVLPDDTRLCWRRPQDAPAAPSPDGGNTAGATGATPE